MKTIIRKTVKVNSVVQSTIGVSVCAVDTLFQDDLIRWPTVLAPSGRTR